MHSKNPIILRYSAAATTLIAGILHLMLVPNILDRNVNTGIFFLVGGLAQIFWLLPIIREWGRGWYYVGIAGTVSLIGIWAITRIPNNPITGRGGSVSGMAIAVEVFQIAFIILSIIILVRDRNIRKAKESSPLRS